MELEKNGLDFVNITLPLEDHYRVACQAAIGKANEANAGLSEGQLEAIGRETGRQALYEAFTSGEVKTSNTFEPYPEYYGRDWDKAHPFKVGIAGLLGELAG